MNNRMRVAGLRSGVGSPRDRAAHLFVDWFFHGHLAVPLIAAGLTGSALLAVGAGWSWRAILLAAAGANVVYQLESLGSGRSEDGINQPARVEWRLRNHGFVVASLIVSAIVVAFILAVSSERLVTVAVVLAGLGVLYAWPVLPGRARLKRHRWAKPLLIAAAWSVGTVCLPLLMVGVSVPVGLMVLLVVYRFLFLLPNALCSDVPDIDGDRAVGLSTVASTLGIRRTKHISLGVAAMAGAILITLVLTSRGVVGLPVGPWAAVEVFGLISIVAVINSSDAARGSRFRWLLDGVLLWFLVDLAVLSLL